MNEQTSSSQTRTDFELAQFANETFHEVQALVYSEEDGSTKEDKFTGHILEALTEAGETDGVRLCNYEKENQRENTELKINGYAFSDNYETLDIFVTHYVDTNEVYKLKKAELISLIKWSTNFAARSLKGYEDQIEPSHEAFNLAKEIRKYHRNFDRVNIFILTNGIISHDPPKNFVMKALEEITVVFHIWDIERLHRLAMSSSNREPIEIDILDFAEEGIPCLKMPAGNEIYDCYLAIVPGTVLATLYRNYSTRLLESNVRAFLQQTGKINKGIRDTIRNKPEMFFPYNNGLAATAQNVNCITDDEGQLIITKIKDFQIVNGGQTTASLFHTEKKFKADLSKVFVQMKLTVIKDDVEKNRIVPLISRFANSQNKVSELDLSSNNPFLQKLEELSRTTYSIDPNDRNKQSIWFFERVKGQYKEALNKEPTRSKMAAFKLKFPLNQKIIKSEVAKFMNQWKKLPHIVSRGSQKNYTIFMKTVEEEFKKKEPNRIYFEDLVACAILFRAVDQLFGRKGKNPIGDTNLKSYTVTYSISFFHHLTNNQLNLGKIWNEQSIPSDLLNVFKLILKYIYHHLISSEATLISEYAKKEECWKSLLKKTNFSLNTYDLSPFLISREDWTARYEGVSEDLETTLKYQRIQLITQCGSRFWHGLYWWNQVSKELSQSQLNWIDSIHSKMAKKKPFSDSEIEKGVETLEFLRGKEVDFEEVKQYSNREEETTIDAERIFNRIASIDDTTWDAVIQIGKKTGRIDFNQESVVRTVRTRLKRKEQIDLYRLDSIDKILDSVKKFGVKV